VEDRFGPVHGHSTGEDEIESGKSGKDVRNIFRVIFCNPKSEIGIAPLLTKEGWPKAGVVLSSQTSQTSQTS